MVVVILLVLVLFLWQCQRLAPPIGIAAAYIFNAHVICSSSRMMMEGNIIITVLIGEWCFIIMGELAIVVVDHSTWSHQQPSLLTYGCYTVVLCVFYVCAIAVILTLIKLDVDMSFPYLHFLMLSNVSMRRASLAALWTSICTQETHLSPRLVICYVFNAMPIA